MNRPLPGAARKADWADARVGWRAPTALTEEDLMGMGQEYLGPVRDALRAFEEAVRKDQKLSFESKTVRQQDVDRARENVMEAVMEMARKLEKHFGKG